MFLPRQIIALKRIVSRVAGRFNHPNVRIERGVQGPRAMATDGRRAVVFSWQEPPADQFPAVEGSAPPRPRGSPPTSRPRHWPRRARGDRAGGGGDHARLGRFLRV
jgi:hypothetical protein